MTDTQCVSSPYAVITTPQSDATEAGHAILREGGTAIDAMIAAAAVLCVTTPHMVGLGGDALWMLQDSGQVSTISGIGQAGRRLPASGQIQRRGEDAIATTAAALASWETAWQISRQRWHSRLPWSRLLEPAIDKARHGFRVTDSQLFWQSQRRPLNTIYPDLNAFWCRADGGELQAGDSLTLPALANSLESISKHGAMSFYQGELGHALAEGFKQRDLCLDQHDLAATRAPELEPVSIRYRQGRLYNVAPPCQGVVTLQTMAYLNRFPLGKSETDLARYYHLMVESIKLALQRRNRELCDPVYEPFDIDDWLHLSKQEIQAINLTQAAPWIDEANPADTAWLAAIDQDGRGAAIIQSLYFDWGSACTIGDTGILWQNRAAGFSSLSSHPNTWSPGKRPAHTLNPSLYKYDDGDWMLFGSQGGDGQPQTQTVLATQLIDYEQSLEEALHAPRFLLGRSFFDSTDNLKLEAHIDPIVLDKLRHFGHELEIIPRLSPLAGLAGIAKYTKDGTRSAMHDPRGQSLTLGV